ncbi:hypothetical protein KPL76_07280 [Subtercola sp. PAMC28395]|uniref:hypothetical protein n=1 Tax=Subtercola sp. PAMC28395 TaxID=2846775 RepID=UPI001C0E04FD|nr:hypothetical protein [Subtercola sp. PAMC28395]QWT25136.1 hypothetical protein KPL76_07280 [Subtercola sp. PAMC28395]
MSFRTARLSVAFVAVLVLSGCASGTSPDASSSPGHARIGLAVSAACVAGSSTECVSVRGEGVLAPSSYEDAGVHDATVVENGGQTTVQVTFTDDGAAVLNTLTKQAVQAGSGARLILEVGGEIVGAPAVMEPIEGREVSIIVAPEDDAQTLVRSILGR